MLQISLCSSYEIEREVVKRTFAIIHTTNSHDSLPSVFTMAKLLNGFS